MNSSLSNFKKGENGINVPSQYIFQKGEKNYEEKYFIALKP